MRFSPFFLAASATALPTFLTSRSGLLDALLPNISIPFDYTFGVRVPTSTNPSSTNPLTLLIGGYTIALPMTANTGTLVSWIANYASGKAYNTQITSIVPSVPRNITTNSTSTSTSGGPSLSNATAYADGRAARVVTTSFSSGNASSAAAAALDGNTSTSTSSSRTSNSTAVATSNALGRVLLFTSANTANILNSQSLKNAQGAEAASSCASDSGAGADAQAAQINSLYIPISTSPDGTETTWLKSSAYAACSAGVAAPQQGSGGSSAGSQASFAGVSSSVTCDGVTSSEQRQSTTFRVVVKGRYMLLKGFSGAVGGERVAESESMC